MLHNFALYCSKTGNDENQFSVEAYSSYVFNGACYG